MTNISNTPFIWAEFDQNGKLTDPSFFMNYQEFLKDKTDIMIVSHGWKTGQQSAWDGYDSLWAALKTKVEIAGKTWGVVGVSWPSAKYKKETDGLEAPSVTGEGGIVAAAGDDSNLRDLSEQELIDQVLVFAKFVGTDAGKLLTAIKKMDQNGITTESATGVLEALDAAVNYSKPGDDELSHDAKPFLTSDPTGLFFAAQSPVRYGNAGGEVTGIGDTIKKWLAGPRAGIANILEFTTFWEMKKRAGKVGASLGPMLVQPHLATGPRFHLVGHSFGGRLVTAAASALVPGSAVQTLVLMQAAFSHNGLTAGFKPGKNGAFCNVVTDARAKRIAITHTHKDKATTIAYPIASRLSQDITTGFGGIDDEYGAMGANGARMLPDNVHVRVQSSADGSTVFSAKLVTSVDCTNHVRDHNDVWTEKMAKLIEAAI
jgi:hypothetical protein